MQAAKTCESCRREVGQLHRRMCGNCYRIWRRDNGPPNATCATCGRAYFRRKGSCAGGTCSTACYGIWKVGRDLHNELIPNRERPPLNANAKVDVECAWCGRPVELWPYLAARGARYCSLQCNAARKQVPKRIVQCERCCGEIEVTPKNSLLGHGRFCSRRCMTERRDELRLPPGPVRGRSYHKLRDSVIRDHPRCARCASTNDLLVHHRARARERPDLLMDRDNLQVLCRSCHAKVHGADGHNRIPEGAV